MSENETEEATEDPRETLDDIVPGEFVASLATALSEFPDVRLPYEAVVYEDGEIIEEELATAEAVRIKSEAVYGTAVVERDIEPSEEDPETITYRILDPRDNVREL